MTPLQKRAWKMCGYLDRLAARIKDLMPDLASQIEERTDLLELAVIAEQEEEE